MYSNPIIIFIVIFAFAIISNEISPTYGIRRFNSTRQFPPSDGYQPFPALHVAYKVYEIELNWWRAREACEDDNAHLGIIDTLEKIELINDFRSRSDRWLHVGFYYSPTYRTWARADTDLPAGDLPWAPGAPDGHAGCAGMTFYMGNPAYYGLLFDYDCDQEGEHFICEKYI